MSLCTRGIGTKSSILEHVDSSQGDLLCHLLPRFGCLALLSPSSSLFLILPPALVWAFRPPPVGWRKLPLLCFQGDCQSNRGSTRVLFSGRCNEMCTELDIVSIVLQKAKSTVGGGDAKAPEHEDPSGRGVVQGARPRGGRKDTNAGC
eukprot:881669-Rhodomonas_salina.3